MAQWNTCTGGICYSSGKVGIGTAAPQTTLEINGTAIGIGSGTNRGLQFLNYGVQHVGLRYDGAGNLIYEDASASSNPATWFSGQSANFLVRNGRVGIGTTSPQYALSVNGTIQAKEVIVNTGWSDYVFDPAYTLPSLGSIADYIKENHHLPGMPSAIEVAHHGVAVGEIESKLLAKVEELTLHMIRLEQENEQLRRKVEASEAAIAITSEARRSSETATSKK